MAALMQAGMLDIELASRVHVGYLTNILKNVQQAKRERSVRLRADTMDTFYIMNCTLAASVVWGIFVLWLLHTHYSRPYFTVKSRTRLHGPSPRIYSGNYSDISELGYLKCIPQWMSQYGPTFICHFGIKPVIITEDLEIRPLFGDFMFFISLPRLFLLPAFFTIINNFLAKFKFKKDLSMPTFIIIILAII